MLYFIMLMRILKNARRADDRFGMLICVGVAGMFFAHIFENIGMTMALCRLQEFLCLFSAMVEALCGRI